MALAAGPALGQSGMPAPQVIAARVAQGAWADTVRAPGTLKADESVTLSATVTDVITAIDFDDGDEVEAGQRLIQLDDEEERARLRAARASAGEAQNALRRATQLQERNLSARADVEDSQARLDQARAEAAALEARLANYRITAPFSGRMGLRNVSVGTLVSPGDELATLDKLDVMRLDASIPAVRLGQISPGSPLRARTRAFPERTFRGEVASIDTRVDPIARSVTVRARLDNPDARLRPGMLMQVELDAATREALTVPEAAIVSASRSHYVWRLDANDNNRVERRRVELGTRRLGEAEVLAGLERGDLVVVHGAETLRDGQTPELLGITDDNTDIKAILRQGRSE
ncbi:efflux RND transporter periplasmic adaptor subunit [Halomonas piscis]|uniref:Efflux RND transporter periplasmic adaptor subunit n=3 Tax=Halomonas piscis TaxID=3031727 RepID=A0ABY9YWV7_9GAMM|nr:efflux RND transporter periplasmic adaptor subunit [Halomonas piscis]WNK19291.1 efflux RND transporter periplasmic adaptor subunit [Halomonas piscis]